MAKSLIWMIVLPFSGSFVQKRVLGSVWDGIEGFLRGGQRRIA
ncbi:MAG TPA: hypothetical protein VNS22_00090 [Geminicoccus sp.]|nr:hypothetical protein [Geminicoccus sp.]HWL66763.1 hypothetical protein [Geminicoccus sp.]